MKVRNTPLSGLALGVMALFTAGLRAQPNFVYTDNDLYSANSVSAFSADANGVLTEITGSPFPTGGGGTGGGAFAANRIIVGGPGGTFVFAANGGSHNIAVFSIDPNTGSLSAAPGSPFPVGGGATWGDISLAVSPDGRFLFAGLSSTNNIAVFSIAPNGALTPNGAFAAGGAPNGVKVSPDGKFLAVALPGFWFGAVAMFGIGSGGVLTPVPGSPFPDSGAGFSASVDINCAGDRLFDSETSNGSTIVDVFSIASNGALARIPNSPFTPGVGGNSGFALLSPNDQLLFVANEFSNSVTAFGIGAGGSLSLVAGSPVGGAGPATNPSGMATDQAGEFLYVAANPNLIEVFGVAAGGVLSAVAGSPFSTSQQPGLLSLAAFPAKACASSPGGGPPPADVTIKIDIKPGHDDNQINPKSHGKIRVAILSSATFNASAAVDTTSLTFGHTGDEQSLAFCMPHGEDVNHDRMPDLVCRFYTEKTGLQPGDAAGILKGKTLDGTLFEGKDSIHTVPLADDDE